MKSASPMRVRRSPAALLSLAGGLTLLAVALGASDVDAPPSKERALERMIAIGERVAELHQAHPTVDVRRTMERLMHEYQSLSDSLGGDDPAHLANPGPDYPARHGDEGGLASAPPAPAGCTASTLTFSNPVSTPIPNTFPNGVVTSTISVGGVAAVLADVNLTTFITHTDNSDLDIALTSPAGTTVTITTDNGGVNASVFNGTLWDDDADPNGQVPYASNSGMVTDQPYANNVIATPLTPEEPLGAFIGENPNGVWTLTIVDDLGTDSGTLNSWSLDIGTVSLAPSTTLTSGAFTGPPIAIGPGAGAVSSTITINGAPPVLADVNVVTTITHSNNADLDVTLLSPAGTVVSLTTDNGGANDNVFNGTFWDDDSNPSGTLPHLSNNGLVTDHTYANLVTATPLTPEEPLAAFIGENPNGMWTLTISDDAAVNGGSLASWSLAMQCADNPSSITTTNFTNTTPVGIEPPATIAPSTIIVSGAGAYLWDIDLTTFISHTASGDVDVTLQSPGGAVVTLTTDNGGTFDNVYNGTLWDDDADALGQVPYSSNDGLVNDHAYLNNVAATPLAGEEALGAFIGENPNGTWTLTVHDDATNFDNGTLTSWSINVTTLSGTAVPDSPIVASNSTSMPISTGAPPQFIASTVNVVGAGTLLCDVNASLNVSHTFSGDLDITLQSPAGTIVTLTTDNGGGNNNVFAGTLFDDDANPGGQLPHTINNGLATDHLYVDAAAATTLAPEEALAAFIGENPNGLWTLTINDDTTNDGGMLNSWAISVTPCMCGAAVCDADINGDNAVNVNDLLSVIVNWGACPAPCIAPSPTCPWDIAPAPNGDCQVNVNDLLLVITSWGPCP